MWVLLRCMDRQARGFCILQLSNKIWLSPSISYATTEFLAGQRSHRVALPNRGHNIAGASERTFNAAKHLTLHVFVTRVPPRIHWMPHLVVTYAVRLSKFPRHVVSLSLTRDGEEYQLPPSKLHRLLFLGKVPRSRGCRTQVQAASSSFGST